MLSYLLKPFLLADQKKKKKKKKKNCINYNMIIFFFPRLEDVQYINNLKQKIHSLLKI